MTPSPGSETPSTVGARVVAPADARVIRWIGGSEHRILLDGAATGGRLTVIDSTLLAGAASPVHVHPDEDETLVVTSGELIVWAGSEKWTARAGDTVFLARGVPHTYRSVEDAKLLTICNPAGMDKFFDRAGWDLAAGEPPADWAVTREALGEAAAAGGQIVLGRPLGPDDEMPERVLAG